MIGLRLNFKFMKTKILLIICLLFYHYKGLGQIPKNRISDAAEILGGHFAESLEQSIDELKNKKGIDCYILTFFMGSPYGKNHELAKKLPKDIKNALVFYVRLHQQDEGTIVTDIIMAPTDDLITSYQIPDKVVQLIEDYVIKKGLQENYSGSHIISGDVLNVLKKSLSAIGKIGDQNWNQAVQNYGEEFSKRFEYRRDYAGFDMNYYEFFPVDTVELNYKTKEEDVLKALFEGENTQGEYIIFDHTDGLIKIDESKYHADFIGSNQADRRNNLIYIQNTLKNYAYIHTDKKVSDWGSAESDTWILHSTKQTGFVDKDLEEHKLIMALEAKIKKNEYMPIMAWRQNYGVWKATRCNIFAADFSSTYLPNKKVPWGSRTAHTADGIYKNVKNFEGVYELSFTNEVVQYAKLGFPVYIVTPTTGKAGHIAIYKYNAEIKLEKQDTKEKIYKDGIVVQAGDLLGIQPISEAWKSESKFMTNAKAFVYLKYLIE